MCVCVLCVCVCNVKTSTKKTNTLSWMDQGNKKTTTKKNYGMTKKNRNLNRLRHSVIWLGNQYNAFANEFPICLSRLKLT